MVRLGAAWAKKRSAASSQRVLTPTFALSPGTPSWKTYQPGLATVATGVM